MANIHTFIPSRYILPSTCLYTDLCKWTIYFYIGKYKSYAYKETYEVSYVDTIYTVLISQNQYIIIRIGRKTVLWKIKKCTWFMLKCLETLWLVQSFKGMRFDKDSHCSKVWENTGTTEALNI